MNPNLFPTFEKFHISPITEFSDHKYIEFAINANVHIPQAKIKPEIFKMSWKDSKLQDFVENIKKESCSSKLLEMCNVIDQNILSDAQVNTALHLFVEAVHDAADPVFLHRKHNKLDDPIESNTVNEMSLKE